MSRAALAPTPVRPLHAALDRDDRGPLVRVLVRVGPDGVAALHRHGAVVGARAGDIVTATVPLESVLPLLAEPSVRAMEAATTLRTQALLPLRPASAPGPAGPQAAPGPTGHQAPPGPTIPPGATTPALGNDSANADAGFDALRRLAGGRWEGLVGQRVIIGVYDSGLDLAHGDFRHPNGATRVLFAWDQTSEGAPPGQVGASTFGYGVECTSVAIDQGACPMVDRIGHGTHVTGVAAADGSATARGMDPFRFPGGAPAADLVIVKGGDVEFTADRLVDGVAYIFARAEALGRPAVVNISLSSQAGPHDGSTLLERALDALVGPGRIVVAGAGNAGDHRNTVPAAPNGPNHAAGMAGGSPHAVVIPPYRPAPGDANDGVLLELWYSGADSLAITIRTPRGDVVTAATGDSATLATPGGAVAVLNALDGPAPGNDDHAALIAIFDLDEAAPPDSGSWVIEVAPTAIHGDGAYHLWLTGWVLDADAIPFLKGGTSNRFLVGVPASADRVLAAGGHVTRHWWLDVDREPRGFPLREAMGDIAYFSSPGPRRDGVQKPDLTAPAKVLVSARSSDATLWDRFDWLIEADSAHAALLGTSMAAPQVAAAVALLLQIEPSLSPEQLRDLLRLSATADAFVPVARPHPVWGAGKLDAAAAVRRLRPQGLAGSAEPVNLSSNPVRGRALVINYPDRPRSLAVYTLIAERVRTFDDAEIGPLSTVWPLDADGGGQVANGAYVLVVEFEDRRVLRKLFVARP